MSQKKHVLVLFSYKSHARGYIERLFSKLSEAAAGYPLKLHRGSLYDMHIYIKNDKLKITESLTNKPLNYFDVIYFELWFKAWEQALAVSLYADRHNTPFFSRELMGTVPMTKLGEVVTLANNGLRLPDSFISSRSETKKIFKKSPPLTYPLIVKALNGQGGKDNYLAWDYKELCSILDSNKDLQFIVQKFISNDGDYRCLIVGGKIALIFKRIPPADSNSHLNNTSQGAVAEVIPNKQFPIRARQDALKAARLLNRNDLAGIDIIIDSQSEQHYILEVNQAPQIETGAETAKKTAALLEHMTQLAGAKGIK